METSLKVKTSNNYDSLFDSLFVLNFFSLANYLIELKKSDIIQTLIVVDGDQASSCLKNLNWLQNSSKSDLNVLIGAPVHVIVIVASISELYTDLIQIWDKQKSSKSLSWKLWLLRSHGYRKDAVDVSISVHTTTLVHMFLAQNLDLIPIIILTDDHFSQNLCCELQQMIQQSDLLSKTTNNYFFTCSRNERIDLFILIIIAPKLVQTPQLSWTSTFSDFSIKFSVDIMSVLQKHNHLDSNTNSMFEEFQKILLKFDNKESNNSVQLFRFLGLLDKLDSHCLDYYINLLIGPNINLEELKKFLSRCPEKDLQLSVIGKEFKSLVPPAFWETFFSNILIQKFFNVSLSRNKRGQLILTTPIALENKLTLSLNQKQKPKLIENDVRFRELFNLHWKDSQASFCHQYQLDESNFSKWKKGKINGGKSLKAVQNFLKEKQVYFD